VTERADSIERGIEALRRTRAEIGRVIVGQEEAVEIALAALLCEGHVLFEGVPGLGKTLLARSVAACLSLRFAKIQFTPDLMPSDILGTTMITGQESSGFGLAFERGPIFANIVLADEINRASPKTQSAMLEAMQERAVTLRGATHSLPRPFLVLATQNPIEMEGTYPLPEAQIDRFLFKAIVSQPEREDLVRIVERTVLEGLPLIDPAAGAAPMGGAPMGATDLAALHAALRDVVVPPVLVDLAARIVLSSQPERPDSPERVRRYLRFGAGPRGAQALVLSAKASALLDGRANASIADLERFLLPALRHRIALNFEGQSAGVSIDGLLRSLAADAKAGLSFADPIRPAAAGAGAAAGSR